MNQADLLHTWQIKRSSLVWRYYNFLYEPEHPERTTFCRLWWGIVLSPLAWVIWLVVAAIAGMTVVATDRSHAHQAKKAGKPKPPKAVRVRSGPSKAAKMVEWIAARADTVAAFFQRHPLIGKSIKRCFITVGLLVAAGIVLGSVSITVWALIFHFWGFITGLKWGGGVSGGLLVAFLIGMLFAKTPLGDWCYRCLLTPVGHFFRGIGHFLYAGYYAVKTRTCPRISLTD